jgi:AraC-like DNA-binding protein
MEDLDPGIISRSFVTRLETQEIDELAQHIKQADVELVQLSRAQSPSSLTLVSFDNINLQIGNFGAAFISNTTTDKERSSLVFKCDGDSPTVCNGHYIDKQSFMFHKKNSEHIAICRGPCNWIYITFKPDFLEESLLDPLRLQLNKRKNSTTDLQRCSQQSYLNTFYGIVNKINELVNSNPLILQNKDIFKGMEMSLVDSQILVLSNTFNPSANITERGKKSHVRIIRQSNDFLEAISYRPMHLLDLCNTLNVGLRTLYYAFSEYYGISPIRYLRLLRYAKARRDLVNSDPDRTTVTDIAAKWHFWHFGRFSVEYKSLYGESPSETLNKGMAI